MTASSLALYIADSSRRAALARDLETSPQYLWQIANRWRGRRCSPLLARRIETATSGAVQRHELRPDVFDAPATGA